MSTVVGIMTLSGQSILAKKDSRPISRITLDSSTSVPMGTVYTDLRVVWLVEHQGRTLVQMLKWCAFDDDVVLSQSEWDKLRVTDFMVAKGLQDNYLQATSGIALA